MDEDQQQQNNKIDIDSFFNRVDAVEGIASKALKQTNLNANAIQANKTLINSISVTIETMKTEIRDIANYIVLENKLERDKKEDEKFEEQDKKQKEAVEKRIKEVQGAPPEPKDIKDAGDEKQGPKTGGGFLGGLFKVVAGLGLAAGLLALAPFIGTALVVGAKALLVGFILATVLPPIVKLIKKFIQEPMKYIAIAIRNTLGRIPLIKGPALAWADSIESGAEKISGKLDADAITSKIQGGDTGGGDGTVTPEGGGGGQEVSDSNVGLTDENIAESAENINNSVDENDNKKMKVTKGKQDRTLEDLEREYEAGLAKVQKMKDEGRNVEMIAFEQRRVDLTKHVLDMKKAEMGLGSQEDKDIGRMLKEAGMGEGKSSYSATREFKFVEPADEGKDLSMNLLQNSASGNNSIAKPQVTNAEIKKATSFVSAAKHTKNTYANVIDDKKLKDLFIRSIG
tara:strand:- start:51 stop:1418 length:1368 start_codon:yes stop_codon:yes gene_type:complete